MIDTHCHIDLYDSPLEVAKSTEQEKIETVAVTYLPSHYQLAREHLRAFEYIHPALGLHPLAAHDHVKEIPMFKALVREAEFIGEVGLDFSPAGRATRDIQQESFALVVDSIRGTSKFVTVHSRGAEEDVLRMLAASHAGPVVFHWFSGSPRQLSRILDAGHRISLNAAMVSTTKWQQLISSVPRNSVLTESDGPFAKVKRAPAYPASVSIVLRWLAERWNTTNDKVAEQVADNYKALRSHTGR